MTRILIRHHHHLCLLLAAGGFAVLYLAASRFVGDMGLAGLSDEQVRAVCHFSVYGLLAAAVARALSGHHLAAWLITVVLATGEEVHQFYVPSRFACVDDWLMNVAGITTFLVISAALTARR